MQFLQKIRYEATLEEYKVFTDYAEMAVQFGYVTLWSVIWPLAPLMAFLNNFVSSWASDCKLCCPDERVHSSSFAVMHLR